MFPRNFAASQWSLDTATTVDLDGFRRVREVNSEAKTF
jgi:hypothetical protein